jgi:hypothetical protein
VFLSDEVDHEGHYHRRYHHHHRHRHHQRRRRHHHLVPPLPHHGGSGSVLQAFGEQGAGACIIITIITKLKHMLYVATTKTSSTF